MKIPDLNQDKEPINEPPLNPDHSGENENGASNGVDNNHVEVTQQHEEAMFGAIDAFCSSSEQTYEQFLQCFSYFRPDGGHASIFPHSAPRRQMIFNPSTAPDNDCLSHDGSHRGQAGDSISASHGIDLGGSLDEDALEEEVLGAGSMVPNSSLDTGPNIRPMVKMDNFVDDEGQQSDPDDQNEDDDITGEFEPYIPNFGQAQADQPSSCDGLCSDSVAADEKHKNICDDESQEIPPKDDLSLGKAHNSSVNKSSSEIRYDSAGEPITPDYSAELNITESDEEEELRYNPELDHPNPGEITDSDIDSVTVDNHNIDRVTNVRQMEYSAKTAEVSKHTCSGFTSSQGDAMADEVLDEIQPFSLDDDFDYDNVILTPKYSAEEMQLIMMAMNKVTV